MALTQAGKNGILIHKISKLKNDNEDKTTTIKVTTEYLDKENHYENTAELSNKLFEIKTSEIGAGSISDAYAYLKALPEYKDATDI